MTKKASLTSSILYSQFFDSKDVKSYHVMHKGLLIISPDWLTFST